MVEQTARTFICTVVFVDLVEYSRKSVSEQILLKETCNALVAEAIDAVPQEERIILDTGDGVAMTFLGDPEDALYVGLKLRDSIEEAMSSHSISIGRRVADGHVRIGINLGPVKIATNINGGANIVGDGIGVAERIMGFALPGQLLVSRSFFEMVSRLSDDYGSLFKYDGNRTDANGRVHDLFLAGSPGKALATAERGARERKRISSGGRVVNTLPPAGRKPETPKPEKPKVPPGKAEPAKPAGPAREKAISTAQSETEPVKPAIPDSAPMPAFSARSATLPPMPAMAPAPAETSSDAPAATPLPPPAMAASDPSAGALVRFLEDRFKVGFVALLLLLCAAILSLLLWQKNQPVSGAPAVVAAKTEAVPAPQAAKPEALPAVPASPTAPAEKSAPRKPDEKPPAAKALDVRGAAQPVVTPPPPTASTAPAAPGKPASAVEAAKVPPAAATAKDLAAAARDAKTPAKEPPPPRERKPEGRDEKPAPAGRKPESPVAATAAQVPPPPVAQPVQVPVAPPVTQPVERTAPAAPPPSTAVTKISGSAVEFPVEAARAGVSSGRVKVRLRIDSSGTPVNVEIIDSRPTRVFDRAVRNTMKDWRFNPGADNRTYEAEIEFNK